MLALKKIRVVWIVAMNVTINHCMAGTELFKDNFKGLSTICNIVGLPA